MIAGAKAYIEEKLGAAGTEEPTVTPEDIPLNTEDNTQFEQEENQGGFPFGWVLGGLALAGAGAGGYYYYTAQKKREAAQRLAQKKAAQQRRDQAAVKSVSSAAASGTPNAAGKNAAEPAAPSAQQAARFRTTAGRIGTTGGNGQSAGKPYSKNVENPYGRYTSSGEEDSEYTASFKPEQKKPSSGRRRKTEMPDNGDDQEW